MLPASGEKASERKAAREIVEKAWTLQQAAARRGCGQALPSVGAQYANRCVDSIETDTQMRYAAMTKQRKNCLLRTDGFAGMLQIQDRF
jgi:L-amino acid N-acyltransferase YncA